jgi:hypothetical protein
MHHSQCTDTKSCPENFSKTQGVGRNAHLGDGPLQVQHFWPVRPKGAQVQAREGVRLWSVSLYTAVKSRALQACTPQTSTSLRLGSCDSMCRFQYLLSPDICKCAY